MLSPLLSNLLVFAALLPGPRYPSRTLAVRASTAHEEAPIRSQPPAIETPELTEMQPDKVSIPEVGQLEFEFVYTAKPDSMAHEQVVLPNEGDEAPKKDEALRVYNAEDFSGVWTEQGDTPTPAGDIATEEVDAIIDLADYAEDWSDVVLPSQPQQSEWEALAAALVKAFNSSDCVDPSHPAAVCIRECNVTALMDTLEEHCTWESGKYTRNSLLKGAGFEVMVLCWAPGARSPVHSHGDRLSGVPSNCFMRVLEGTLFETTFTKDEIVRGGGCVCGGEVELLSTGQYAYINDAMGVHRVGNPSREVGAISLHVYAPGWTSVRTFDEVTPEGEPLCEPKEQLLTPNVWGEGYDIWKEASNI